MNDIITNDDLCLTDPPVLSFDEESPLNVLLHGSEFNNKVNREMLLHIIPNLALHLKLIITCNDLVF